MALASSITGLVFGKQAIAVMPPFAAAYPDVPPCPVTLTLEPMLTIAPRLPRKASKLVNRWGEAWDSVFIFPDRSWASDELNPLGEWIDMRAFSKPVLGSASQKVLS